MKTNYLLPHRWKKMGLWVALPFAIAGLICIFDGICSGWLETMIDRLTANRMFEFEFFDEIIVLGLTASLLVAAFSRERDEDEFTTEVRARSLVWSVVLSYGVVVIGTLCLYSFDYLAFLCANLFTVLIAYILIFNISMARLRKEAHDEK